VLEDRIEQFKTHQYCEEIAVLRICTPTSTTLRSPVAVDLENITYESTNTNTPLIHIGTIQT